MIQSRPSSLFKDPYSRLCFGILMFIVAMASFQANYVKWNLGDHSNRPVLHYHNDLIEILNGTAARPFVYRRLLPDVANSIANVVPDSIKQKIMTGDTMIRHTFFNYDLLRRPLASLTPDRAASYEIQFIVVYWLNIACSIVLIFTMYGLCRTLSFSPLVSILSPISMMLLLPYFETIGGYDYDYPEFAFIALAALVALRYRISWLIPLAVLGTWNKESFLFFIPTLYPLLRTRVSRKSSILWIGVCCALSAAIYLLIRKAYGHNAGSTVEFRLWEQIRVSLNIPTIATGYDWTYGFPFFRSYSIYLFPLIIWTWRRGFGSLPPAVRNFSFLAMAINIPLYLFFCAAGELRNLSMLYVSFLLVLAGNLQRWEKSLAEAPSALNREHSAAVDSGQTAGREIGSAAPSQTQARVSTSLEVFPL